MSGDHIHAGYSHGAGIRLEPEAAAVLERGLRQLVQMTAGMEFRPLRSEKYPLPLCQAVYATPVRAETARKDVEARCATDPVSVLEHALVLLELHESNRPEMADLILEDMPFIGTCFNSKRCSGWIAAAGSADRAELEKALNARWQFRFYHGRPGATGPYVLLNMLARYAFIYGRIADGDFHALGHFVEDFCPGVLVYRGAMSDLESTLVLASMKMGVPAVVPAAYPFTLGCGVRAESPAEIAEAVVGFRNVRRLLVTPEIPPWPAYCDSRHAGEKFESKRTWGDSAESFYLVRKGDVPQPGVEVLGQPAGPLGILVTLQGEPLDAFDRRYIERAILLALNQMAGVRVVPKDGREVLQFASEEACDPRRLGEVLCVAVRREFPKLQRVRVQIVFDPERLARIAPDARREKEAREKEIATATEENVPEFYGCVGCSPFAPDHMCVLTPQRPPQCGRPYEMIKTGALYGYDDMSNIHHSHLHREINSFGVARKGTCVDPVAGEWEGLNRMISERTHGRTTRVQLHSIDSVPHTGCGCFRMIMFKTDQPKPGIGIMEAGYKGRAPDGRRWADLHYALGGKQTPGMAGASLAYLLSPKFLQAHGGWKAVVWVGPKIAQAAGAALPAGVMVGPEVG